MGFHLFLLFLLPVVYSQVGTSSHACYNFPSGQAPSTHFEAGIIWVEVDPKGFVYGAMQFWFENGQGGYFGGQYLSDGSHIYNYAIWDYSDSAVNTSMGVDPWCTRFGGEGAGSHCQVTVNFTYQHEYRMKLIYNKSTTTQDWWTASAVDLTNNKTTYIGTLGLDNTKKICPVYGNIKGDGNTGFQEYPGGGNFYSGFGWTGPYILDPKTSTFVTAGKAVTCGVDAHHGLSDVIPSVGTGKPYVYYEAGLNVTTSPSGQALWSSYEDVDDFVNVTWRKLDWIPY